MGSISHAPLQSTDDDDEELVELELELWPELELVLELELELGTELELEPDLRLERLMTRLARREIDATQRQQRLPC